MKRVLLLLLISGFCFGQNNVIEIKLVNIGIGRESITGIANASNDTGLNLILQNNNVTRYERRYGHPILPESYYEAECTSCNINQLYTDLLNYSSVVEKARITSFGSTFLDVLSTEIQSATIGIPTGSNNGIITTNDVGLNLIFQNFNVFYYSKVCSSCTTLAMTKKYYIGCNCDNVALKSALDSYTSVINFTEFINSSYWLSNNQFQKSKTSISPNPFKTNFIIQTEEPISNYSLIDISGKQLISTSSKNELDDVSSQLNSGVYFLTTQFENSQNCSFKLVKN